MSEPTGRPAESRAAKLFLFPALAAIAAFFAIPVAAGFVLSLTDFDLYAVADPRNARWVGLKNYVTLLQEPLFWRSLLNTLFLLVVGGPLTLVAALGGALLVNSRLARLRGVFRTIYFAPVVTTLVAVAIVFHYLYHPRFGLLNHMLALVGLGPVDWLGQPRTSMLAITVLVVWRTFGYSLVILVAGLQAIPETLYEAARLDGATARQQFLHLTLPLLKPTLLFVTVLNTVGFFQIFAEPYVMTRGGPLNSTMSIALLMYQQGFRWWNMGRAAAIAFVLFALIMLLSAIQQLLLRRRSA